jgi:hypothetical protein
LYVAKYNMMLQSKLPAIDRAGPESRMTSPSACPPPAERTTHATLKAAGFLADSCTPERWGVYRYRGVKPTA